MKCFSGANIQATLLVLTYLGVFPVLLVVQANAWPAQGGPLIVLSAPWSDPNDAITAAGGYIVAPQRAPFGVFAVSDDPAFAKNLASMGLRSINNATLFQLFCGDPS